MKYGYMYCYVMGLIEITLYGVIFSLNVFRNFSGQGWKHIVSFFSLIFLIQSISLVFYITSGIYFLSYIVMIFSLFIMLTGLIQMSGQSMGRIVLNWVVVLFILMPINGLVIQGCYELNLLDEKKYKEQTEEVEQEFNKLKNRFFGEKESAQQ